MLVPRLPENLGRMQDLAANIRTPETVAVVRLSKLFAEILHGLNGRPRIS
jgi:hypothetical protein